MPVVLRANQSRDLAAKRIRFLPEFVGEQPLFGRQYGNVGFEAGLVVVNEAQEPEIGRLALTQTSAGNQRHAKDGLRQHLRCGKGEIDAALTSIAKIIRQGATQPLVDVGNTFVVFECGANRYGGNPVIVVVVLFNQQTAKGEVVEPHVTQGRYLCP